jgi:predicted phage terminase large subunit-like protein
MPTPPKSPGAVVGETVEGSLTTWVTQVTAPLGWAPAAHHRRLLRDLEAVASGDIDRLMVLMPPGSAKSTYASLLFPAWWFTRHPRSSIIAASHTADLAQHFGRQLRALIADHTETLGYSLRPDSRAAGRWQTSAGGEYFATGLRGPIAGRRADLVIIDDPIKSHAAADSPLQRDHLWNWYRADLTTRLRPSGRVILIMTRWHEDDLAGRLLAQDPSEWHKLRLPALAEADDPLGRREGEALWPEWEDAKALLRKRLAIGERAWAALFQQSPRPPQGSLFNVTRIETIDTLPVDPQGQVVRAWDFAATLQAGSNDPDWTVGVKLMRDVSGRWIVVDVVRLRGSPRQVEEAILASARIDGRAVKIGLPEDPGQAGKTQISYLSRVLAGYVVSASRETGSKTLRASPVAAQVEAGNLLLLRAGWNHAFLEELRDFPHGRKDDQVDALARAFSMLTEFAAPARRIAVPVFAR